MPSNKTASTYSAVLILALGCSSAPKHQAAPVVTDLPRAKWHDPSAFASLVRASHEAKVVQLGESIHLTREMPSVRIGAMKALNEYANFDVLAIEGSAVDSWLAMDILLRE